jgi:hypothetical protein
VTARTTARIPPTDTTGRGRQVDGIMPAGGLTETTRQTTSAEDPSSDAISFCLPIKWRLTVCTRYEYPKPTHQCGASGGRGGHARPAEGWTAEAAIAFSELVQPCATTLNRSLTINLNPSTCVVHLVDAPPTNLQSAADLKETSLATWRRGRRAARADRACRKRRAAALPPRACSRRSRRG